MTDLAIAHEGSKQVTRPLTELARLIKIELTAAKEAVEKATKPHHERIADLLAEARAQMTYAETVSWAHRNFGFKETASKNYLSMGNERRNYVTAEAQPPSYKNMWDYRQRALGENLDRVKKESWHAPVKKTIEDARKEAVRLRTEELSRAQEREAERKLALRMIDLAYKILSKEFHPDRGGSKEAQARLNRVRDRLKSHA